jgi:hypothetical protein
MTRVWNGMFAGYLCTRSCITDCRRWKVAEYMVSEGLEFYPRWCVFVVMWPLWRWRPDICWQFCATRAQDSCVRHLNSLSFFHYGNWNTWLWSAILGAEVNFCHYMYHQVQHLLTCMWMLYESQNKQQLFPCTTLIGWFYNRDGVCLLRGTDVSVIYVSRNL